MSQENPKRGTLYLMKEGATKGTQMVMGVKNARETDEGQVAFTTTDEGLADDLSAAVDLFALGMIDAMTRVGKDVVHMSAEGDDCDFPDWFVNKIAGGGE